MIARSLFPTKLIKQPAGGRGAACHATARRKRDGNAQVGECIHHAVGDAGFYRLPAPVEEDLSKEILDAIDMDSYRVEKQEHMNLMLTDSDTEIDPLPVGGSGDHGSEHELVRLSEILKTFNEQFGTLFSDADRIFRRSKEDVFPAEIQDPAYQNDIANTPEKTRLELTAAVKKAIGPMLRDDTELYKQSVQNESLKQFVVAFLDQLRIHHPKHGLQGVSPTYADLHSLQGIRNTS